MPPVRRAFVDENFCLNEGTIVAITHSIVNTRTALNNSTPTSRVDIILSCRSHPFSFNKQYMLDLYAYGNYADKLLSSLNKGDRVSVRSEYTPLSISSPKSRKKKTDSDTPKPISNIPERYPFFSIKKLVIIQSKSPSANYQLTPDLLDLSSEFKDI